MKEYQVWHCKNYDHDTGEYLVTATTDLDEAEKICEEFNDEAQDSYEDYCEVYNHDPDEGNGPSEWYEIREVHPEERF